MIWEKFQKLSARERGLLALAVAAVLAAFANFLVVQPTVVRFKEIDKEIEDKTVLRERNAVMLEDQALVEEEFRAASALLKMWGPSSSEEIEVLKAKVGDLAGEAGVVLDSINHREPTRIGHCDRYVIEISRFEARIPDLLRFLHVLSDGEGMLRIGRLTFKPRQKSDKVEGALAITRVALGEALEEAAPGPE